MASSPLAWKKRTPADGRATLVRFTASGQRFLNDALAVTSELEAEFAATLGDDRLQSLRAALIDIVQQGS